jgi:hypothetical protein
MSSDAHELGRGGDAMLTTVGRERRAKAAVVLALGSLLALAPVLSFAAPEAAEPIKISGSQPVQLSLDEATAVSVVNDSPRTWRYNANAYFDVVAGKRASESVSISHSQGSIRAGGSEVLELGPIGGSADRVASGFLVVTAEAGNGERVVVRATIGVGPTKAESGVTQWTDSSDARWPRDTSVGGTEPMPLMTASCSGAGNQAFLSSDDHTVEVAYTCRRVGSGAQLQFDMGGASGIGKYTGTATIGDTDVSMTYTRTTTIFWPLLVIFIGFIAAAAQQAWVNNLRPLHRLDNRLAEIGSSAIDRQTRFEVKSGTATYRRYRFLRGVMADLNRLGTEVNDLRPPLVRRWLFAFVPWSLSERQEDYDALIEDAARLGSLIESLGGLADDLKELRQALDRVAQRGDDELAPELVAHLDEVLNPAPESNNDHELDRSAAAELVAEVTSGLAALALLPSVRELDVFFKKVEQRDELLDSPDKAVWYEGRRLFHQARNELLSAKTAQGVNNAEVDVLVRRARTLLLQLERPADQARLQAAIERGVAPGSSGAFRVSGVSLFSRVADALFGGRAGVIRAVDATWLLVATLVAAWSGLSALYVGKAWGTWQDYIALFAWAFGTTAILTPLLTGLERVAAGALQLHTKPNDVQTGAGKGA